MAFVICDRHGGHGAAAVCRHIGERIVQRVPLDFPVAPVRTEYHGYHAAIHQAHLLAEHWEWGELTLAERRESARELLAAWQSGGTRAAEPVLSAAGERAFAAIAHDFRTPAGGNYAAVAGALTASNWLGDRYPSVWCRRCGL